ncbi:MAG: hypothetical protein VYB54_09075 [Pseudomonadota bacterium]|nr:hypothetical protein [Pseudomonadota bacterium]
MNTDRDTDVFAWTLAQAEQPLVDRRPHPAFGRDLAVLLALAWLRDSASTGGIVNASNPRPLENACEHGNVREIHYLS